MPEEPTLTDVATTLQFCIEQLELCNQVLFNAREMGGRNAIFNALHFAKLGKFTLERSIRLQALEQAENLRAQAEGAVPA